MNGSGWQGPTTGRGHFSRVITAIDTNVLLDLFGADPTFGPRSRRSVRSYLTEGHLIACDVVWTEVASFFLSHTAAQDAMDHLGVSYSPIELEGALAASQAWKAYRRRGGQRDHMVADFLIGAHAASQAERLLTRDRGFYRTNLFFPPPGPRPFKVVGGKRMADSLPPA